MRQYGRLYKGTEMIVVKTISTVRKLLCRERNKGTKIGLVPTMGALHAGHLSLVRKACKENDYVVVSLFVNPLQFGINEDFDTYPETFKDDKKLLEDSGVDMIFYPSAKAMYSNDFSTVVVEDMLSKGLCGKSRMGHFKGVVTVVCKLFNVIQPCSAYFGKKDYQQLRVIERMVRDLCFPIEIRSCATVRQSNGLALSSRNKYLSSTEIEEAQKIYKGLKLARAYVKNKSRASASELIHLVEKKIQEIRVKRKIEYIDVLDAQTLERVDFINRKVVVVVAVLIGTTRLIDNIEL